MGKWTVKGSVTKKNLRTMYPNTYSIVYEEDYTHSHNSYSKI